MQVNTNQVNTNNEIVILDKNNNNSLNSITTETQQTYISNVEDDPFKKLINNTLKQLTSTGTGTVRYRTIKIRGVMVLLCMIQMIQILII